MTYLVCVFLFIKISNTLFKLNNIEKLGLRSKHKRFNALPQGGSLDMMKYESAFPNLLFDSNVLTARRNFAKQIPHRAGNGLIPISLNLFTEQADQMNDVISEVCKATARPPHSACRADATI